jgi:dihydrofolate synthase / folylpolyglutamate synthase
MTTIDHLFSYFESFTNLEKNQDYSPRTYRLDRMQTLLTLFGNPHTSYKTIHLAGTKGKGSTAAFIASVLTTHGYRTGLYTSPHVSSYCERITVNRLFPDTGILLTLGNKIKERIYTLHDFSPTTFELLTLLAFCYFRETACDYAVVETGIGGRLDATNVVFPFASIITPVDIEHTEVLGTTLEEIAMEKAGIIKQGIPVFAGIQKEQVRRILQKVSEEKNTHTMFFEDVVEDLQTIISPQAVQCSLKLKDKDPFLFTLSMTGEFQAENAGLAFLAVTHLFPEISLKEIQTGLHMTTLPGRFEIIRENPAIILDGAHTPLAVRRICAAFKTLYPGKGILLFGSIMGKKHEEMAEILAPEFSAIVVSTPGKFKESDPSAVYEAFRKRNRHTYIIKNPQQALEKTSLLSGGKYPLLVTGSFYMVSEIRKLLL